jgi:CheY-like chemotaxis protein
VDDEAFFLNLSTKVLRELGYDVTPVDDSRAALEIVTQSEKLFDIVVTDQTMPKMTGLDLIQHIRDLDLDIPVIICTGFSENINTKTAEQIGVADILFKPVTKRDLAGAIRRVLDKSSDQAVKHGQPSHY